MSGRTNCARRYNPGLHRMEAAGCASTGSFIWVRAVPHFRLHNGFEEGYCKRVSNFDSLRFRARSAAQVLD